MPYEGELAALATAFCWSATSLFFHAAGKRIGALQVNQIRTNVEAGATTLVGLDHLV